MTHKNRAEYREAFEAWVDGELQERMDGDWKDWTVPNCPLFTLPPSYYRRRPKPLECWAVVDKDGVLINSYGNKEHADRHARLVGGYRVVHMREVRGE